MDWTLRRASYWVVVGGLCGSWGTTAFAVVGRHDVAAEHYEAIGLAHPESGYWGVASEGPDCSGTLVSPTHVLTAAHCIPAGIPVEADGLVDADFSQHSFFALGNRRESGFTPNIQSIRRHPAWNGRGQRGDIHDLAIITLSEAITDVIPAKVRTSDPDGLMGTIVGYGFWGDGRTGIDAEIELDIVDDEIEFDIVGGRSGKRGAHNILHVASPDDVPFLTFDGPFLAYDFDAPGENERDYFSDTLLDYEGNATFGDSGGAVYASFPNGTFLVGITSGGDIPPHLYPDELTPEVRPNDYLGVYGSVGGNTMLALDSNSVFLQDYGIPITVPESEPAIVHALAGCMLLVLLRKAKLTSKSAKRIYERGR